MGKVDSNERILNALHSRTRQLGISTAAPFLRRFEHCLDGACPTTFFQALSPRRWRSALKHAESQLVYDDVGMVLDDSLARAKKDDKLPPHSIASFPAVITTTRQDRDGDVLETKGANLDPRAPLLWQHLPFEPIGRLLAEGKRNTNKLTGSFAICDTPLGNDAATLCEFGALRVSHGFLPSEAEPLDPKEYDNGGFRVLAFDILEVSLVSVPSNPDAVITAFSREKLMHPLVKQWAGAMHAERPVMAAVGIDVSALGKAMGDAIVAGVATINQYRAPACTCHEKGNKEMPSEKSVVPYKDTPIDDEAWNGNAATKALRAWAGVDGDEPTAAEFDKYSEGFALIEGDKTNLTSYKLPHHTIKGGKLVAVGKGVSAAIGALNGARGGGMDISEADRKGAYNHLVKHWKKAFPDEDPPELKSPDELRTKGFYLDFENSWDDIRDDLSDDIKSFMMECGCAGAADLVYIAEMFSDFAIVCVIEDALYPNGSIGYGDDDDRCYYRVEWEMDNETEEPQFTGEPTEIEITLQIEEASERAFAMISQKAFIKAEHVKKLEDAADQVAKVINDKEAHKAVKGLAKRAMGHIKAVVERHDEKGVYTESDHRRLEKASGYLADGADHDEAEPEHVKCFKSAGKLVDGVVKAMDEDAEKFADGLRTKAGRRFSKESEKKIKSAKAQFHSIAMDDAAHPDVSDHARKAADALHDVLSTGGDSGSDYDENGEFTGADQNAYADNDRPGATGSEAGGGKSSDSIGTKVGRKVSKESAVKIGAAIEHGKAIVEHEEAAPGHKATAKAAVKKLKDVMGDDSEADQDANQDDDDGDMSYYGGNPTGSRASGKQLAEKALRALIAEHVLTSDNRDIREAAKKFNEVTTGIERRRQFDEESALVESALASL